MDNFDNELAQRLSLCLDVSRKKFERLARQNGPIPDGLRGLADWLLGYWFMMDFRTRSYKIFMEN